MKKQSNVRHYMVLVLLMVALVISGYALTMPSDTRSRAANEQKLFTQLPYPPALVSPPYLRLFAPLGSVKVGDTVMVSVLLHTNGQEVTEANVTIPYDPTILSFVAGSVKKTAIFASLQEDEFVPGSLSFTLFSPLDGVTAAVTTKTDTEIATVSFTVISNRDSLTQLTLYASPQQGKTSALYGPRLSDGAVYNILKAVQSTQITIR